jgi:hypothetical protein
MLRLGMPRFGVPARGMTGTLRVNDVSVRHTRALLMLTAEVGIMVLRAKRPDLYADDYGQDERAQYGVDDDHGSPFEQAGQRGRFLDPRPAGPETRKSRRSKTLALRRKIPRGSSGIAIHAAIEPPSPRPNAPSARLDPTFSKPGI